MSPFNRPIRTLWIVILSCLTVSLVSGCRPRGVYNLTNPTAPPGNYFRRIMLVLEKADYRPVAKATVTVETEAPTRLVSPAGGIGRTDVRGTLELVFAPLPNYDRTALAGGDIIVDFPIKAKLTISLAKAASFIYLLDEKETFARYADPLYQGLTRDPEAKTSYHLILIP